MVLSHGIYRILWFMVPSHEILKLNEAEPSMAGAVVPEHKNTTLTINANKFLDNLENSDC